MTQLIALLRVYYQCSAMAEAGLLDRSERFACSETYQEVKAQFLDPDQRMPGAVITSQDNSEAYRRFKAWEAANEDLILSLKRGEPR